MPKEKTIECSLRKGELSAYGTIGNSKWAFSIQWKLLRQLAPALCKGLHSGQSRKLVLTQTPRGFNLERAEK